MIPLCFVIVYGKRDKINNFLEYQNNHNFQMFNSILMVWQDKHQTLILQSKSLRECSDN